MAKLIRSKTSKPIDLKSVAYEKRTHVTHKHKGIYTNIYVVLPCKNKASLSKDTSKTLFNHCSKSVCGSHFCMRYTSTLPSAYPRIRWPKLVKRKARVHFCFSLYFMFFLSFSKYEKFSVNDLIFDSRRHLASN